MVGRKTGLKWLPKSKIDKRDWLYSIHSAVNPITRPSMVDQRPFCGRIMDQGDTNACTGYSTASADELLRNIEGRPYELSPRFNYYNARARQGWTDQDNGAYIMDAVKAICSDGSCPLKLWDDHHSVFEKPGIWARSFASLLLKRRPYYKITDKNMDDSFVDDVRDALARGYTVVGGITLHANFYRRRLGVLDLPPVGEEGRGAHAIHWVGYIDLDRETYNRAIAQEISFENILYLASTEPRNQGFLIGKNSWGVLDGYGGYFLAPYEYVDENGNDFWAIGRAI